MRDTDTSFLMDHFLTDQFLTIKIFLFRILYLDLYQKKKKKLGWIWELFSI